MSLLRPSLGTYGGALLDPGYEGMIVDMNPCNIENYSNSGATGIDFGVAVGRAAGDADGTCKAIGADTDVPAGISVRHVTMPYSSQLSTGTVLYAQFASVPVLRLGLIWCIAAENVARDTQALSITAQGGRLGGVSAGAAAAGRVAFPAKFNVTWETTTAAGALGQVRIVS